MRYLLILISFIVTNLLIAQDSQPVTFDPAFPGLEESITVKFDATKGNRGLENCNCDVYLHTGVITNESTSNTDWKFVQGEWGQDIPRLKMTKVGDNAYEFDLVIKSFYNIPDGVEVRALTFVLRNVNGSLAGRATDGSDIVVDLFTDAEGIIAQLNNPSPGSFTILNAGESINISGVTNESALIRLEESGTIFFENSAPSTALDYSYLPANDPGFYTVDLIAVNAANTADIDTVSFSYLLLSETVVSDVPEGMLYGLNRNEDGSATFVLHAPGKESVILLGSFNDWTPDTGFVLNKSSDGQDFWITINDLEVGQWHTYQYLVDGTIRVADPYSEIVLDPFNDQFIPTNVNNQFPDYPSNLSNAGNVTAFKMEGFPYDWTVDNFEKPANQDLFIYELLVRDFLESHSYKDLIDTLDYLQNLGVNAIELMPINEFEGNISWGYNPSFHMALDKYYGDPITFKRFVDEAHSRGIAVLLDVVYNHAFSQSPFAQLYWDAANFRPAPDNPWLNVEPTHPFNVGYDFNHESQSTKDFVSRVVKYWVNEYRIDGYRFDLTKGFTQNFSGDDNNIASRYDQSRIDILTAIGQEVWEEDPNSILILEHFAENSEERALANLGFLLWGNLNFNYNEATMGYHDSGKSDFSWGYYANRGWNSPNLITYMESHDEERLMYKNTQFGNSNGAYNVKEENTGLDRIRLANTFFWTIPGPKMIWQFGELGYDFSINYCPNGTINNSCRVDVKPITWDYNEDKKRKAIYYHISDLAYLKSQFSDAFATQDVTLSIANPVKQITLNHSDLSVVAIGNFDVQERNQSFPFPQNGTWYNYLNGERIDISGNNRNFTLQPGEHQLWITQDITRPNLNLITTSNQDLLGGSQSVDLYPNPASNNQKVEILLNNFDQGNYFLRVLDVTGKVILSKKIYLYDNQESITVGATQLSKGMYLIKLIEEASNLSITEKLIVH